MLGGNEVMNLHMWTSLYYLNPEEPNPPPTYSHTDSRKKPAVICIPYQVHCDLSKRLGTSDIDDVPTRDGHKLETGLVLTAGTRGEWNSPLALCSLQHPLPKPWGLTGKNPCGFTWFWQWSPQRSGGKAADSLLVLCSPALPTVKTMGALPSGLGRHSHWVEHLWFYCGGHTKGVLELASIIRHLNAFWAGALNRGKWKASQIPFTQLPPSADEPMNLPKIRPVHWRFVNWGLAEFWFANQWTSPICGCFGSRFISCPFLVPTVLQH